MFTACGIMHGRCSRQPLLLHLVGYLYYWQMGFNSVFKGLMAKHSDHLGYDAESVTDRIPISRG